MAKNEDDIVPGSNEWRALPHCKRRELQAQRLGGHVGKVMTLAEAKEAGITFDDSEGDTSHIPDPNNRNQPQPPVHKAVMRDLTPDEAESLRGTKAFENWQERQPDKPVQDDTMPSDRNPKEPGVTVTKVRSVDGSDYRIERRNPFGLWVIPRLEELGTFVTLQAAEETLKRHLEKGNE